MPVQVLPAKTLRTTLWLVQGVLALFYVGGGFFKVGAPLATLAGLWPWAGEYPTLLRFTGAIDILGGVGIIVPALTHIKPRLTILAASGLVLLQLSAIAFHLLRGEAAKTPFNFVLLALTLFVLWKYRVPARVN